MCAAVSPWVRTSHLPAPILASLHIVVCFAFMALILRSKRYILCAICVIYAASERVSVCGETRRTHLHPSVSLRF